MNDVRRLVRDCRVDDVEPYVGGAAKMGGSQWRLQGVDLDGVELGVGVEAFLDHLGRRVLLLTVFG